MKIYFVRHAETIWHKEDKYAGHTEIELTDKGYAQAEKLKNWAVLQEIKSIYTSSLQRSILTAAPTAIQLQISPKIEPSLNEVNFGDIEGLSKKQFSEKYPLVWKSFQKSPADTIFPNGESGRKAVERALNGLSRIVIREESSEILIVSHGTLIRLLLSYFQNNDLNDYRRRFPVIDNIGVTTIILENMEVGSPKNNVFKLLSYNSKIK